jgi:cation:H+ antiporter
MFIVGLVILLKASSAAIKYAVRFSALTGLSHIAVGFILLAVSTSLPELAVIIIAFLDGASSLGVGTLVGSNIADIGLVLGLMILFLPFRISKRDSHQIYKTVGLTSLVCIFALVLGTLNLDFGVFALIIFVLSMATVMEKTGTLNGEKKKLFTPQIILTLVLALVAVGFVIIGAKLLTNAAVEIAEAFGLAETLVGVSIVAVGTSLPELAVGVQALRKKNYSLALGDVIGSLLTNLTLLFGISTILSVFVLDVYSVVSLVALLGFNLILFFISEKKYFSRKDGLIMFVLYLMVMAGLFWL